MYADILRKQFNEGQCNAAENIAGQLRRVMIEVQMTYDMRDNPCARAIVIAMNDFASGLEVVAFDQKNNVPSLEAAH